MNGAVSRAGKTKNRTPIVQKTSEKEQTNKKTRLRKKFNVEVKSGSNGADNVSKITAGVVGLTHKDIDRQMFRREKHFICEAKYRSWQADYSSRDTNTKKPHKKERQAIDEFFAQQMFGDLE